MAAQRHHRVALLQKLVLRVKLEMAQALRSASRLVLRRWFNASSAYGMAGRVGLRPRVDPFPASWFPSVRVSSAVHCKDGELERKRRGHGLRRRGGALAPFRFGRMADYMDDVEHELAEIFGRRPPRAREIFEGFFPSASSGMRVAVDVKEEDGGYKITADVPGLSKSDISIQVSPDRVLAISGERKTQEEENEEGYYRMERRFGKFMRSFQIPKDADDGQIKAKCEAGVLSIWIPKIEKEVVEAKVIDIE